MRKTFAFFCGDIDILLKKESPEEILSILIYAVNKDIEDYFWFSVENFDYYDEICEVKVWVNNYRDLIDRHLPASIRKFLDDNGYHLYDLLENASSIFSRLIVEARDMFPGNDKVEEASEYFPDDEDDEVEEY